MNDDERPDARGLAIGALARREHSRRELERKLGARGVEREAITEALDGLAADGLQNDARFADAYVRMRAGNGFGPRRIALELRERGLEGRLIETALGGPEYDWAELASAARAKKFRGPPRDTADRARQSRFLEYRGFDSTHIRHALRQAADHEDL